MSEYEPILSKKVKQNPVDYSKFTNFTEKDYLPHPREGFSTIAIHAGQEPEEIHGSVNVPIHLSTTYKQRAPGVPLSNYDYTRCGNPTRAALEEAIATSEYGKYCNTYSSGVASMTAILHQTEPGDHIICCDDAYGGTQRYLRNYTAKSHQCEVDFIDTTDIEIVKKHLKKNTRIVWLETPTNPTLKVSDIAGISKYVHDQNKDIIVVVDNTFLSPYLQSPLLLGADVVTHSVSKYIAGHSDVIMGAAVTNNKELFDKLLFAAKSFGGNPSPFDCYMALRGFKTLEVRMKAHCYNAYCLAHFLQESPYCDKVFYSGLKDHPAREIIQKQQRGFGGMVSFQLKGGLYQATKFLQSLKTFILAESLGGVEGLAEVPAVMTHGSVPKEHRELLGITDGFIRLSVGIESIQDILADVDHALAKSQT